MSLQSLHTLLATGGYATEWTWGDHLIAALAALSIVAVLSLDCLRVNLRARRLLSANNRLKIDLAIAQEALALEISRRLTGQALGSEGTQIGLQPENVVAFRPKPAKSPEISAGARPSLIS